MDVELGDVEAKEEKKASEAWKPEKKEWLVMLSLTFISFMVALDATILVTVLPVGTASSILVPRYGF